MEEVGNVVKRHEKSLTMFHHIAAVPCLPHFLTWWLILF